MTGPALHVDAFGWTLRVDRYGLAIHHTDAWERDHAEHDCTEQHPDGPCDYPVAGFTEDDLLGLLLDVHNGVSPYAALAEFTAAVRAEPAEEAE